MLGDSRPDANREAVGLRGIDGGNSTPDSIRFDMNATLRARRSSFAMIRVAP